jgi:hypothetical protein
MHPYSEVRGTRIRKILRVERPLPDAGLSGKKRSRVLGEIKDYAVRYASSNSCDLVEFELYERIAGDIFFPSSLSTVGTFNYPEDFGALTDTSFDIVRSTICFELTKPDGQAQPAKKTSESGWRKVFFRLPISLSDGKGDTPVMFEPSAERLVALQPYAFNLPQYCLVGRSSTGDSSVTIRWFPDLFLLSKDNWKSLIDYRDEVLKRILGLDRATIYLVQGIGISNILNDMDKICSLEPFEHISRFQFFANGSYRKDVIRHGGKVVHAIKLLRSSLS